MNLSDIRKIVKKRWTFDEESYPVLKDITSETAREQFIRGHILKHMLKSVGRIAAIEEDADHGKAVGYTREGMRDYIAKMTMNLMQLAESWGISDKEIAEAIRVKPV